MDNFEHPVTLWDHFDIAMVRNFALWEDTSPVRNGRYVHLSPGKKFIRSSTMPVRYNWDNLDYPQWDANNDPLPYEDESVNGIFTSHSMDHWAKPVKVLAEVQRVLVTGGWFVNITGHYSSEIANNCFEHRTKFAVDSWRNAFSERVYDLSNGAVEGNPDNGWHLRIGFNMMMGIVERNVVLVTQLIKTEEVTEY